MHPLGLVGIDMTTAVKTLQKRKKIHAEENLIDGVFRVEKKRWGTWTSYNAEGHSLVTSLSEELCIAATRFYLKGKQEGFSESDNSYEGFVGGKL